MYICIPSHGLKRSWHSCPRRMNAATESTPSMHHSQRRNVTTSMVGLKKKEKKKKKKKKRSHTQALDLIMKTKINRRALTWTNHLFFVFAHYLHRFTNYLLFLVRQMETPVSSMKVAVHRRSPQATVELAGYRSVVRPDSLFEWLVGWARL